MRRKRTSSGLRYLIGSLFTLFLTIHLNAQNTVGVITNSEAAVNGYVLYTFGKTTYLIDNCGQVVNSWVSNYPSGKSVYLLENGDLLRTAEIENPGDLVIPGRGGRIERFDWDNNLLWSYNYGNTEHMQHHDIYPLPNGNILILAITEISGAEAVQLGRNPANLSQGRLYNEQIVELQPVGTDQANIVWEWNVKDHLIQDFDNTKANFGAVDAHPEKLDINFLGISGDSQNWLHFNSIQYNEKLDQLLISSRMLSEIYIIDHSTTTQEAASGSGGKYGKGGDFLYRWGNPQVYDHGMPSDQVLFGQHYPHWVAETSPDAGKIILFNNGINRPGGNYSEVLIIQPPVDINGNYDYSPGVAYDPETPDYTYTAPVKSDFSSNILSGAQQLSNGHIFICEGTKGHLFEVDENKQIVWEYFNPVTAQGILSQGDDPAGATNSLFRAQKFEPDYPAFSGKDLTPGPPVELNPDLSQCSILSVDQENLENIRIFPNPAESTLYIVSSLPVTRLSVYDVWGKRLLVKTKANRLNISRLTPGIYFVKIQTEMGAVYRKIIRK